MFWGLPQKPPRTKIRMIMLARAQKVLRDWRGQHARYLKPWLRAQDGSLCCVFVLFVCLFSVCLLLCAYSRARVCACVCVHVFCARVRAPLLARRCFCVCLFALRVCPACFFVCLFALVCRMVLRFQQRLHAQKICMQYFQPPRQSAIV